MENKIDLTGKLDFSEIDLTAPDKVVQEILSQLPEQTQGLVMGKIVEYDGPIESYTRKGLSGLSTVIGTGTQEHDIQKDLGASGEDIKKFECFIFTPVYENYKYRVFFMQYNLSHYPVKLVLEKSVAQSVNTLFQDYIVTCDNRDELEEQIEAIFTSKRLIEIMQEIIRIYQAKNSEKKDETNNS